MKPEIVRYFRTDLPQWFEETARDLPWRRNREPYLVWISEIMLQQTRVDQMLPYFHRFIDRFPSVEALASASLDEVLHTWEGLGYYARARNLHRSAQIIVKEYAGKLPDSYDELRRLPGIGAYTAAAIVSIAYNKPYAVVDGNVIRVLSRIFEIEEDVRLPRTRSAIQTLADELVPLDDPGAFNQAMMELGATICTPRNPRCEACPLRPTCGAYQHDTVNDFPVVSARKPIPHYDVAVGLIFNDNGHILIQKRPEDGMLGGLWEFPGGKRESDETIETACRRELREELGVEVEVGDLIHRLNHAYTHFKITLHAFRCRLPGGIPENAKEVPMRWVPVERLRDYAFPRANRLLIDKLLKENLSA